MSYDPIPAAGAGAQLFDQPSLFYLTNRELIEEWHGLQSKVVEGLNEWYSTTLREALQVPAESLDLVVSLAKGPQSWRHVVLHPAEATILGDKPVIGVGLAWPSKSANPSADSVFACVRCSRNQTGKKAAATFLEAGGRALRSSIRGNRGANDPTWPIWRWIRSDANWWTDLDHYRDQIVSDITDLARAVIEPLRIASTTPIVGDPDETE